MGPTPSSFSIWPEKWGCHKKYSLACTHLSLCVYAYSKVCNKRTTKTLLLKQKTIRAKQTTYLNGKVFVHIHPCLFYSLNIPTITSCLFRKLSHSFYFVVLNMRIWLSNATVLICWLIVHIYVTSLKFTTSANTPTITTLPPPTTVPPTHNLQPSQ